MPDSRDADEIGREIADRLTSLLEPDLAEEISPEDNLLEVAEFDSLLILEMLVWLENRYSIAIPDEDVEVEQFASVNRMRDYVLSQL